jgi:hypothetical protein
MTTGLVAGYVCIAIVFVTNFSTEASLRKNQISEKIVTTWVDEENPVFIGVYGYTFDLDLMKLGGFNKYQNYILEKIYGYQKENYKIKDGDIVIFYSRYRKIKDEDLDYFSEEYLDGKKLQLVDSIEESNGTEVEYSTSSFSNCGNGFFKYSYKVLEDD